MSLSELVSELNQKHIHAFTGEQPEVTSIAENQDWKFILISNKGKKKLKIDIEITFKNFKQSYPSFNIRKQFVILPFVSAYGARSILSVNGKRSDLYDKFCEFPHLEYLFEFRKGRVGWKSGKITYTARIRVSEPFALEVILKTLARLATSVKKQMLKYEPTTTGACLL